MTVYVEKPEINIREKLTELEQKTGQAGKTILAAHSPQEVFQYINAGRRNVLINGNFEIAQRGTSGTYTGGIWQYLSPDRWMGHFDSTPTGATHHVIAGGPNAGSNYFAEVRGPSSGGNGNCYFGQRIESRNLANIRYQNAMVLSGWVKRSGSSTNTTLGINIICPTATDNYAGYTTHGAPFRGGSISGDGDIQRNGNLTLSSPDVWYYFTAIRHDPVQLTNFDKGMQLYFSMQGVNGTDDKFQFAQMQLEAGTVATPFEHRIYAEELELCKRYFQKFGGGANKTIAHVYAPSTTELALLFRFAPEMRVTPSVDWSSATTDMTYRYNSNNSQEFDRNDLSNDGSVGQVTPQGGSMWINGWSHGQTTGDGGEIRVYGYTPEQFLFIQFDSEL